MSATLRVEVQLPDSGKPLTAAEMAYSVADTHQRRLFVREKNSGDRYLVDTGACISVIPARSRDRKHPTNFPLYAANGTTIKTYGEDKRTLNVGLRRPLSWTFVIADITSPIIGADFLFHHHILVDLRGRQLLDAKTGMTSKGTLAYSKVPTVYSVPGGEWYYDLLRKYPNITRPSTVLQKPKHQVQHFIETKGPPVTGKARRLTPDRYNAAREEFLKMVDEGICRPSNSPYASPLHIVMKKDGKMRFCGDYRRLNEQTVPDRYSVPNIQGLNTNLSGKSYFSKLDLNRAYYQVPVAEEDIKKTAVITPFGLFEFLVMCFGLRNAAQTFQRLMDSILSLPYVFVYLDDILVASSTVDEHRTHLDEVFRILNEHGLTINPNKSEFCKREVEFLGFLVTPQGIKPLPAKVNEIVELPRPNNKGQLRRFLGMLNFYRRCIPNAAEHQRPLHALVGNCKKSDSTTLEWTEETNTAFHQCQQDLKTALILAHPSEDAELTLACDASNTAIGAVLQQREGPSWKPLGFFSKALTSTEQGYSTYDRELIAIHRAIRHFRPSIEGRNFAILTDHKPLIHMFRQRPETATPMRIRLVNFISQFSTDIRHVSGGDNVVADALSRMEEISLPDDMDTIAVEQEADSSIPELLKNPTLTLKWMTVPTSVKPLLCETSTSTVRPYLPGSLRHAMFIKLHNLSHPGIRGSRRLVTQRFFWPNMNVDIATWSRSCVACQRSKIQRHTVTPPGTFAPVGRFAHIHIDIIGPLPTSDGKRYCLTMADRFTRWPEAEPVADISAETIVRAFYRSWICRYGVPAKVTTDQGRQFESELFRNLTQVLGTKRCRTTAYHPQTNGCIERWHRTLKTALTAHLINSTRWTDLLSTVLLGLRAAVREDNNGSAAELVFGQPLCLPGELLTPTQRTEDTMEFLRRLREHMKNLRPAPHRPSTSQIFVPKDLKTCSHVFLRNDAVRQPLTPPYTGPHLVLDRQEKTHVIQLPTGPKTVSTDRLKPAYTIQDTSHQTTPSSRTSPQQPTTNQQTTPTTTVQHLDNDSATSAEPAPQTRQGRPIRLPVRFCDSVIGGR